MNEVGQIIFQTLRDAGSTSEYLAWARTIVRNIQDLGYVIVDKEYLNQLEEDAWILNDLRT